MAAPKPPSVVDFDHLRDFLKAYAEHRRSVSEAWTLGAWARKLGLKHKATLSRVLAGQREAGPELLQRLRDYFPFDEREREYFGLLATLAVHEHGETAEAALRAELARTRSLIVAEPGNDHLLRIDEGMIFAIHGRADTDRVNEYLAPQRLVVSPLMGSAVITLTLAHYSSTSLGPYSEAHLTTFAMPAGGDLGDVGLAFTHHRCDRPHIASLGRLVWGNAYALGEMSLTVEGRRRVAECELFRASAEDPPSSEPYFLETWGFPSMLGGRARFKMRIEGKRSALDIDKVAWTIPPTTKELLDGLKFEVAELSITTDLRVHTTIPTPIPST